MYSISNVYRYVTKRPTLVYDPVQITEPLPEVDPEIVTELILPSS